MLPERIEEYRDGLWRRKESIRLKTPKDVELFVEDVGFCLALTDVRTNMPSVYIGVCGRRDAHMPKNVQKDPESSAAWQLKDEVMRRGNVYYGKLAKGRATFVAKDLIPYFRAIYGSPKSKEKELLTPEARKVMKVLREDWEAATSDLREDTGIEKRTDLTKAIESLQRSMKVIPYDVVYKPKFTYLWTLPENRFPDECSRRFKRENALVEIGKRFLKAFGMVEKGDFARSLGIKRPEAGAAFHKLVDTGFAERLDVGVYILPSLK